MGNSAMMMQINQEEISQEFILETQFTKHSNYLFYFLLAFYLALLENTEAVNNRILDPCSKV